MAPANHLVRITMSAEYTLILHLILVLLHVRGRVVPHLQGIKRHMQREQLRRRNTWNMDRIFVPQSLILQNNYRKA
jgi:hypothetical protein